MMIKNMPDIKDDFDIKISLKYKVVGVYKGSILPGIIVGGKMFKKGLPNFTDKVDYYGLRNLTEGVKSGWFTITECTPENPFSIKATNVTLNNSVLTLERGAIANLTATVEPSDASQEVIWTSSDKAIATVEEGKVTAIKEGNCDILATTSNNLESKCVVNVSFPAISVSTPVADESIKEEKPAKKTKTKKNKKASEKKEVQE